MISKTSKENFVKSKSSEEKVQNIREIYDAKILGMVWPNCSIIINLRNESLASRTSDLALSWAVRHLLKYAVQFSRHRDNEIHKICTSNYMVCRAITD